MVERFESASGRERRIPAESKRNTEELTQTMRNTIPDTSLNAEQIALARVELQEAKARIAGIVEKVGRLCTPQQKEIFEHVYGQDGLEYRTQADAAERLGVSPARIHQGLAEGVFRRLGYDYPRFTNPFTEERERYERLTALLEPYDN